MIESARVHTERLTSFGVSQSQPFSWRSSLILAALIAAGWLIGCLALTRSMGLPDPKVHDEFNYLLGADTFAHGRLTNPPHSLSEFFASPHTLFSPTYNSKYPPGQSFFLAAGQVLFGHPFYGVVIEGVLMIFLVCLALCLWTSLWPAAIASLTLAFFFQPPMYWVYSYWGGCAAVCGGALLLIALGSYRLSGKPFMGCIFAAGVVLLAVTRPYEGIFTSLAVLVLASFVIPPLKRQKRALLMAAAYGIPILVAGFAFTIADNLAITGRPFQLPRQLYDGRYMVAPIFMFQPFRSEPSYPNERLKAQHGNDGWEVETLRETVGSTQHGYAGRVATDIRLVFDFLPQAPLLLFGLALLDRRLWFCLAVLAPAALSATIVEFQNPHYIAPSVPVLALIWGIMIERALRLRHGKIPVGPIAVGVIFLAAIGPSLGASLRARNDVQTSRTAWQHQRIEMIRRLSASGQQNLVIVRYPSPSWNVGEEWVYNGADIDNQRVVLAHDLGDSRNQELLNYYPNRTAWILTFNEDNPDEYFLNPYPR